MGARNDTLNDILRNVLEAYQEHPTFDTMVKAAEIFSPVFLFPQSCSEWLYASHFKELASRIAALVPKPTKQDLVQIFSRPTRAELINRMSDASLNAPLNHEAASFMINTLLEIAGEEGRQDVLETFKSEPPIGRFEKEDMLHHLQSRQLGEKRAQIVWLALGNKDRSRQNRRAAVSGPMSR